MVRIGLVELPAIKLVDQDGRNWTAVRKHDPLVSKQIVMPQLLNGGFEVELVNLKCGVSEEEYGRVYWRDRCLSKVLLGSRISDLNATHYDAWGITVNYMQEREAACMVTRLIRSQGRPVVVGGSDAIAEPHIYLQAGATAVIQDKSGAGNLAIMDYVCGREPREPLTGLLLADGTYFKPRIPPLSPEEWSLPSTQVASQCLGREYWEGAIPNRLLPIGSVMADIGCDRKCDFCQTPTYRLGYKRMSPARVSRWLETQKAVGARSFICPSDQFLARVLWKEGRQEVLEIMQEVRAHKLPVLWGNGLELKKATRGRGLSNSDITPDEELVAALWGWDGEKGCYQAYLPAERPTLGRESYAKLLPWREHCLMVTAIARAGVPDITYGVIVGLPEDSHESLQQLESAISELYREVKAINPDVQFRVTPFAIRPLPGTPQSLNLHGSRLLRFTDPAILGGFWTACADTHHFSYEAVSDWQSRLASLGDVEDKWQGVTGIIDTHPQPEKILVHP